MTLLLEEQAARRAVIQALNTLSRRVAANSTALIFFAGHGARLGDGPAARNYLCTYETTVNDLEGTTISGEVFAEALRRIPAQKTIVFFDVCHAAGIGQPHA